MDPTQTTLTTSDDPNEIDDSATNGDTPTNDSSASISASAAKTTLAPPDQRGGERCCPWCLAAPETFEYREDGHARCGYCDAAIPIGTDWFERGEKIALQRMKSVDSNNRP